MADLGDYRLVNNSNTTFIVRTLPYTLVVFPGVEMAFREIYLRCNYTSVFNPLTRKMEWYKTDYNVTYEMIMQAIEQEAQRFGFTVEKKEKEVIVK